jgi:hypothetical protein
LALLVDHECTQRRENRIRRNIHAAAFRNAGRRRGARRTGRSR